MTDRRLPEWMEPSVRDAIAAMRRVLDDLDNARGPSARGFDGLAHLRNVEERGLRPSLDNLIVALLGEYEDEYEDEDEDEEG
jgi:hypothetical protein